ncbi:MULTISPECIES: hypothetical protein [Sphingobacterium]|jgi:hypothetical protein|uniref:Uncharacterized protein n=2 Tax=Sphingobacterium TaxID=28453 RepID=A0A7G5E0G9_9SPHI|nr:MULTISPECIES: hypothetical protein [Sphingobacterium]MCS4164665.1 hypothetical protein [Sphingobacterium sp. BIGb0116]QMV67494.1 hypothetical protein HS960_07420 [Sphingobacterium paramultivorum]QRY55763.1 hypothetical protein JVX97_17195 [Sphingobacterium siyangense]UQA72932.1 hypothetical protein K2F45_13905 [Sphingobacterium siyangense]WON93454.1 hypothetical protein OK025_19670 [Sphingobacterium sp. UGAL515B_05]
MKKSKKFTVVLGTLLFCSTLFFACQNPNKNPAEGSGQADNIAPSAADETRYNLSEQQKMSMQKDTSLADTLRKDSINAIQSKP